jgi:hypothetical protein
MVGEGSRSPTGLLCTVCKWFAGGSSAGAGFAFDVARASGSDTVPLRHPKGFSQSRNADPVTRRTRARDGGPVHVGDGVFISPGRLKW